MPIDIHPLTPERWRDLETVFEAKGCSIARGCWCMYYRVSGKKEEPPAGKTLAEARRAQLKALANTDPPPGLLAYRDGVPIGWIAVGPREDYPRLERSQVMKPVDDTPVWSVVCFVVPSEYRGQGIALALLKAAAEHARRYGATLLEGYPIDKAERSNDSWLWHGAKSMFDKAGFVEVARRKPQRPVMRLALKPKRRSSP
jgi:GNAT superfamily N-acetyltransferase